MGHTIVWRNSDMKSLSFTQTKQECKWTSSAGPKTGGKPGASAIHQGAIVVPVVRGHRKWKNPSCPVKPAVIRGMKPGWTGSGQACPSPCNSAEVQSLLPALVFLDLTSQLAPSTTTSIHVLWSSPPPAFRIPQTFVLLHDECNLWYVPTALSFHKRCTHGREANSNT